jgi:hypothetical protein
MWLVPVRRRSVGARAWLIALRLLALRSSFSPDDSTRRLAAAFGRHGCLPSAGWPLPSTRDISPRCVPEVACCIVSSEVLSCLEHLLTPLSACIYSSQSTDRILTRTASPANTNDFQRHDEPLHCTCTTPNSRHTTPKLPLRASCSCKLSATSSARPPYTLSSPIHLTPDYHATQWASETV